MGCTDCTKAYELIELPVGSSKDAVKSAPDIWQNRPGWKGAANQLTSINVAIDHLLQCDGAGSSSYTSSGANPNSVSESEGRQSLRQAMEDIRKANHAGQTLRRVVERYPETGKGREETGAQQASKTRTKGWIMFAGICVLFVLPPFLYLTTTLFSSGQVGASNQETTSSDASASSPTQAASVIEDRATVDKDVEQPEAIPVTSLPTPVSPAAPAAPASTTSQTAMPDVAQLKAETVPDSPRPAYVPVTVKVMDDPVVADKAPEIRNPYGFTQRTAPVGYAAVQRPEAQPTSRATTLILRNGPALYVTNVWYAGERIMFTMPNGSHRLLGLEQINFRSTIQANHQTGVGFNPPPGYPGN